MLLARTFGGPTITGEAIAIDGDSLRLHGRELRLAGLDAPELSQVCERDGNAYDCGRLARRLLVTELSHGRPSCRLVGLDRYGRDLARCSINGEDLNGGLVRAGMAVSDGRYQAEEDEARAARRGLWAGSFERPAEWRRRHPRPESK